jgi:Mn2+/Fe2+ NRAMP family transporter
MLILSPPANLNKGRKARRIKNQKTMTNLNGLYILAILVVAAIYTCVGYLWGQSNEKKKWFKDIKEVNKHLNEALGNREFEVMSPKDLE